MSFTYNPYKHIELIKGEYHWKWYCHSCGGESEVEYMSLQNILFSFRQHLKESHGRDPEDFEGWSKY